MARWQFQDAKSRLSELVRKATSEGPQEITLHGKPAVVVLSTEMFEKLTGKSKKPGLVEFLNNSPLKGLNIEFERDRSPSRDDVDLG